MTEIILTMNDDKPDGVIKCTITYWDGIAYKIPRKYADEAKNLDFCDNAGIYFLFSEYKEEEDKDGRQYKRSVYVGQSTKTNDGTGVAVRALRKHGRKNDTVEWNELVIITTRSNSMKNDLNLLEYTFVNMAREAGRYCVTNRQTPNSGSADVLPEEVKSFIKKTKLIITALGYKVFDPKDELTEESQNLSNNNSDKKDVKKEGPTFTLYMTNRGSDAKGIYAGSEMTVCKGSLLATDKAPSCPKSVSKARKEYSKYIDKTTNRLTKDITFTSPSSAGSFVAWLGVNGNDAWHDSEGTKLGKLLSEPGKQTVQSNNTFATPSSNYPTLYLKSRGSDAKGLYISDGEFIILEGSIVADEASYCPKSAIKSRNEHSDSMEGNKVTKNITLDSVSGAAGFVSGSPMSGFDVWHDERGHTLNEILGRKAKIRNKDKK